MRSIQYYCIVVMLQMFQITASAQGTSDDFRSFRQRMHNDYRTYRGSIMERYTEFLDNAWAEFSSFAGKKRDTAPKPTITPVYTPPTEPVSPPKDIPAVEPTPVTPEPTPTTPPTTPPTPIVPPVPDKKTPQVDFTVYGLSLKAPKLELSQTLYNINPQSVSNYWKAINQTSTAPKIVETMKGHASTYQLGDYATLIMVQQYAEKTLSGQNKSAQRLLMQYLMLSMGYDIRLAIANGEVLLLVPYKQQVYSNVYFTQNSQKYYIFPNLRGSFNAQICQIPEGEYMGKTIDLVLHSSPVLPMRAQYFNAKDSRLTVSGEINLNLIDMIGSFPVTDIPHYATSTPDRQLRMSLLQQLKPQVANMTEKDAINALLHFVQNAFEYKTDGEQFGEDVEKAFFVEEMFYYPFSDCEDRSIIFSFLVRNLLNKDVHIILYPGHACTGVNLPWTPTQNDAISYSYKNKRFYICDPTYINANAGSCMPQYLNEQPKVNEW